MDLHHANAIAPPWRCHSTAACRGVAIVEPWPCHEAHGSVIAMPRQLPLRAPGHHHGTPQGCTFIGRRGCTAVSLSSCTSMSLHTILLPRNLRQCQFHDSAMGHLPWHRHGTSSWQCHENIHGHGSRRHKNAPSTTAYGIARKDRDHFVKAHEMSW